MPHYVVESWLPLIEREGCVSIGARIENYDPQMFIHILELAPPDHHAQGPWRMRKHARRFKSGWALAENVPEFGKWSPEPPLTDGEPSFWFSLNPRGHWPGQPHVKACLPPRGNGQNPLPVTVAHHLLRDVLPPGGLPSSLDDAYLERSLEGRRRLGVHLRRERVPSVVAKAKALWTRQGDLACTCCGFDFGATYGTRGSGFIEAHHITPLSNADALSGTKTGVKDLAPVCANCHRMLHREPEVSVEELRDQLRRR